MPLIKRLVEPVDISQGVVPVQIANELEFVANNTLANIMRQLASLSLHAEDLFAELHRDAAGLLYRVGQLAERVDRVTGRIARLNPTVEEVLLQDINMRKPFRSSIIKEQQIITQSTRPHSIMVTYQNSCEPPPPLYILNVYREDGRDSVKFYTDPGYFLELWCLEMAKDTENQMKRHKHRGRRNARPIKDTHTIRAPKTHGNYAELRHGPEFVDNLRMEQTFQPSAGSLTRQNTIGSEPRSPRAGDLCRSASLQSRPAPMTNSQHPVGLYQQGSVADDHSGVARYNSHHQQPAQNVPRLLSPSHQFAPAAMSPTVSLRPALPPPAPPAPKNSTQSPVHEKSLIGDCAQQKRDLTELPAPPTPPFSSTPSTVDRLPSPPHILTPPSDTVPSPSFLPPPPLVFGCTDGELTTETSWQQVEPSLPEDTNCIMTVDDTSLVRDTRSDLLSAIREGIQLRKVEERRQKNEQKNHRPATTAGRLDVQAIMEAAFELRRKALEENDSDDDDVDGNWSDNDA